MMQKINAQEVFGRVLCFFLFVTLALAQVTTTSRQESPKDIMVGSSLMKGFDMGVDSSEHVNRWVRRLPEYIEVAFPADQEWAAVFITVGKPVDPPRNKWMDFSAYKTLSIDMRGEKGGESIEIGIKSNIQKDDGTETKVKVTLLREWKTYSFPLDEFKGADLGHLYVVTEFVYNDRTPQTMHFRNVRVVKGQDSNSRTQLGSAPASVASQSGQDSNSVQELSRLGPRFPESFDMSNFMVFFVVRAEWPIALKYELEEGAFASLVLKPMRNGLPIQIQLRSTGIGHVRTVTFVLPKEYGGPPQTAELRFNASISGSAGPRHANFIIHALGCGSGAFAVSPHRLETGARRPVEFETNRFELAERYFKQLSFLNSRQGPPGDEVAIGRIALVPSDGFNASQGGNLVFSFRSSNDFNMWSASFQRLNQVGGTVWKVEKRMPFPDEPIIQGQTISKSWDGKNRRGHVKPGRYKVMISAWTSANVDGSAVTSFSSPAIQVR